MAQPTELEALYAFLLAAAVTALLTPLTMRVAQTVGAMDAPRERGLSARPTPLLGGLAMFAGVMVAALVWLPGQVVAAVIVVNFGVAVKAITLPFIGELALPNAGVTNAGPVLTVIGLV